MGSQAAIPCAECQRLQQQLDAQRQQLDVLQDLVRQLQEQLAAARKNSSTSSKPPSSDLVAPPKPPPPEGQTKRSRGGQPGQGNCITIGGLQKIGWLEARVLPILSFL